MGRNSLHPEREVCPRCNSDKSVLPVNVGDTGGYIGWFCEDCEIEINLEGNFVRDLSP